MDILDSNYPDEHHVFAYDDATIYTACSQCLKCKSHAIKPNSTVKKKDGTKERIIMDNATFSDGSKQSLYYPANHLTHPWYFKGMRVLIQEQHDRGADLLGPLKLKVQCNSRSFNNAQQTPAAVAFSSMNLTLPIKSLTWMKSAKLGI